MHTSKHFRCYALAAAVLLVAGCAQPPRGSAGSLPDPIRVESAELGIALIAILAEGQEGTLVEDAGWYEFIFDIRNKSNQPLVLRTVKLLNVEGRYFDSAASYGQITAPPDPAGKVAGDVAQNAAGIAAGYIIPFGSLITTAFFSALSAMTLEENAGARQAFHLRVLKNVELAAAGRVRGSAFLPVIPDAGALVLEYAQGNRVTQIEIPLAPAAG